MEPRTEYNLVDDSESSIISKDGSTAIGKILEPFEPKKLDQKIPEVTDTPTEKEEGTDVKENTTLGIIVIIAIAFVGYMVVRFFLNRRK